MATKEEAVAASLKVLASLEVREWPAWIKPALENMYNQGYCQAQTEAAEDAAGASL